jgi:MFS family permease
MLIIGRGISGIGSSGMSAGAMFIGFTLSPSSSTVWGLLLLAGRISSVLRPIIFGALVDKITWRCKSIIEQNLSSW